MYNVHVHATSRESFKFELWVGKIQQLLHIVMDVTCYTRKPLQENLYKFYMLLITNFANFPCHVFSAACARGKGAIFVITYSASNFVA